MQKLLSQGISAQRGYNNKHILDQITKAIEWYEVERPLGLSDTVRVKIQ
jgi:hypothetical protein